MAIFGLQYDGVNDVVKITTRTLAVGETLLIKARATIGNDGTYRVLGQDGTFANFIQLASSDVGVRIAGNNYSLSTGYVQPATDVDFILEVERLSNSYEFTLDGSLIGTAVTTDNFTF